MQSQCGDNKQNMVRSPVQVHLPRGVLGLQVSCGFEHTMVLTTAGEVGGAVSLFYSVRKCVCFVYRKMSNLL